MVNVARASVKRLETPNMVNYGEGLQKKGKLFGTLNSRHYTTWIVFSVTSQQFHADGDEKKSHVPIQKSQVEEPWHEELPRGFDENSYAAELEKTTRVAKANVQ